MMAQAARRDPVRPGALVVSLDFEIHWGVRDRVAVDGPYRDHLLGVRSAVPQMLALFQEFGVSATWATVGFLFARGAEEMRSFSPACRPAYQNERLQPYAEPVGRDEDEDPFHFAPSLIDQVSRAPGQEVATHTFSHYYCLEPGQDRDAFRADLAAALAIARARGIRLQSIVFPRNQHNPAYDDLLVEAGITCYRGNQNAWMYRATGERGNNLRVRSARLADAFLPVGGSHTVPWKHIRRTAGVCNVPASHLVRPVSRRLSALEPLRLRRITADVERAAADGRVVHLWWHPHNFGVRTAENIAFLRQILEVFASCRERFGMQSLTMAQVAAAASHE